MTPEENVLAAAVQLTWAAERYSDCLAEFEGRPEACGEWAENQDEAMRQLDLAIQAGGIDWRDPAIRQRLRTVGLERHECSQSIIEAQRIVMDGRAANEARLQDAVYYSLEELTRLQWALDAAGMSPLATGVYTLRQQIEEKSGLADVRRQVERMLKPSPSSPSSPSSPPSRATTRSPTPPSR